MATTVVITHKSAEFFTNYLNVNNIPYVFKGHCDIGYEFELQCLPSTAHNIIQEWSKDVVNVREH